MQFKNNTDKPIQLPIPADNQSRVPDWRIIHPGESIELDKDLGEHYFKEEVKLVVAEVSHVNTEIVETKQIKAPTPPKVIKPVIKKGAK